MIVVCEPQCRGVSHEKVNGGFIYGLHSAYPKDKLLFFSDKSHFKEIKELFRSNKVKIPSLSCQPISFDANNAFSLFGILRYYFLFKRIFDKTLSLGQTKVFFLSTSPIILYTIKKLKLESRYRDMCCTFVLHGELEDIANKKYKDPYTPTISSVKISIKRIVFNLLNHPDRVFIFVIKKLFFPFVFAYLHYSLTYKKKFRTKKMLLWHHSDQYKYIVLSPHIVINAKKYLDTDYLNFHTIIMPIIYDKPLPEPVNKYIKFAIFGYGDSGQMNKMLTILSKRNITKPYEIRIISMDDRGTEGFQNVTHVGNGSILSRKEMKDSARDIDIFMNLYGKSRHRFGCSLSIFEALSYLKPVLHLSNPGYNYFNKSAMPIGYRCDDLEKFVDKMQDIVERHSQYKGELKTLRNNMKEYRKEYNIQYNLDELRSSFTFT
jgi:hypothetical protein